MNVDTHPSGANTMVAQSKNTLNPFQATPTTLTWQFGTINRDTTNGQRLFLGYRLASSSSNHFLPGTQGVYIGLVSNHDGPGSNQTNAPAILAITNHTGTTTEVARWTWGVGTSLTNLSVKLVTTNSTYALSFTGATPNMVSGSLTGNLTALGTVTNQFTTAIHNQYWGTSAQGGAKVAAVSIVINSAPTDITLTPSSIAENNSVGAAVGNLAAVDADAGDSHTFSLVAGADDTDNGSFTIVGNSLRLNAVADYETKSSYSVRVQADDGNTGTFAKALTVTITDVNEAPTVASISPTSGPSAGGTSVTITGTNFISGATVTIGGAAASNVMVGSATSITCTTPSGSAGTASVLVTTAGGTNAANTLFTYVAPPTVASVSPSSASILGGTSVTLTGTNFTGATGVTIGGAAATSVVVDSATQITCTTPAGTAGTASALVTTVGGTNAANTLYTYVTVTPVVSSPTSSGVTRTTARLSGNITSDGGEAITERGVILSPTATNPNPLIGGLGVLKVVSTGTTGAFSVPVTGLAQGTRYSYKVYAINSLGTSYSSVETFVTGVTGDLFLPGHTSQVVYRVTRAGVVSTFASSVGNTPVGAAFDSAGNLYVSVFAADKIIKFTSSGGVLSNVPTNFATSGVTRPYGLAMDSEDNLFVARREPGIVSKITPRGIVTDFATGVAGTQGLAFDAVGSLYATSSTGDVVKFTSTGGVLSNVSAVHGSCSSTNLNHLTFDSTGNLFVTNRSSGVIDKFTSTAGVLSTTSTVFSSTGSASLLGVAFDSAGQLYLADMGASAIKKFTPSAASSTFASGLSAPSHLAFQTITPTAPTVTTPTYASITASRATLGGNVTSDGDGLISERGIVYSVTSANGDPVIGGTEVTKVAVSGTMGVFTQMVTGLIPSTGYSYKAYATNGVDTSYTSVNTFTTLSNATPTNITLTPATIAENNAADATVGTLAAVDANVGDTHTFALVTGSGDDDNGSFTIAGTALKITASADFETKASYSVRVEANDGNGGTFAKALSISVTNVVETPVLSLVSPSFGSTLGGTVVTLTGTSFSGATSVTFGGVNATAFTVVNDTTITATTPAGSAGAASVLVTTPDGINAANALFNYILYATALNFDGSNDNVLVSAGLPATMSECTVELWIRPSDLSGGGFRTVLSFDNWSSGYLHFQFYGNQLGFSVNGSSATDQILNSTTFNANTWYHVAAVYSATAKTLRWYVNGNLVETDTYTTALPIASGVPFRLGGWNGNERFFSGNMDELRIWSVARSQAEIQANLNTEIASMPPALRIYYKFNEGVAGDNNSAVATLPDIANTTAQNGSLNNFALNGSSSNWVVGNIPGFTAVPATGYQGPPTVVSVTPDSGPSVGGTNVTITGTEFSGATTVTFGGTAATNVAVVNPTTITCTTPGRAPGTVSVEVTTPVATSAANTLFTYPNVVPADITLTSTSIAENNVANAAVGTLVAVDPDLGQTRTFAKVAGTGDEDNASFSIDGAILRLIPSANFEVKSSYSVRVSTSDGLSTFEKALTVTIQDVNEAATDITLSNTLKVENDTDLEVGALAAVDQDVGQTHTFTLVSGTGSTDNALFNISGSTLRLNAPANYEYKPSLSMRIRATDNGTGALFFEKAFTISLTDLQEPPYDITFTGSAPAGILYASGLTARMVYASGNITGLAYSDNMLINGVNVASQFTGPISYVDFADYNTVGRFPGALPFPGRASLTDVNNIVLNVTGTIIVPTTGTYTFAVRSDDGSRIKIDGVTVFADDTFHGEAEYYTTVNLTAGAHSLDFLFFEGGGGGQVELFVAAGSHASYNGAFSLLRSYPLGINENTASGSQVAALGASDDAGNTHTFELVSGSGDTDNASFSLSTSGLLTTNFVPDFETKATYSIRVRATDNTAQTYEQVLTVSIFDINETPSAIALSNANVTEHNLVGSTVGTFSTTDVDAAQTYTYTLVSGTGSTNNNLFSISGSTLMIQVSADYETLIPPTYGVRVRSTDQGGLFTEQNYTINILDANDPATDIALSNAQLDENNVAGVTVGTLSTTDPNPGQTHTYSLVSGTGSADNARFSITGNELKLLVSANYEVQPTYSLRIRTSDNGAPANLWYEKAFTITINGVNEVPGVTSALVYEVTNPTRIGNNISYNIDNSLIYGAVPFNRVRYRMEMFVGGVLRYADTSFAPWSGLTVAGLRVPDGAYPLVHKRTVTNMTVESNYPGVVNASGVTGALEHWPSSYGSGLNGLYDYDDDGYNSSVGYGSFQVHNMSSVPKQTVFAWNQHSSSTPDIGFGNQVGGSGHPDWTFSSSSLGKLGWKMQVYIGAGINSYSISENNAVDVSVGNAYAYDEDAGDGLTYQLVSGDGDTDNALFYLDGIALKTSISFDYETKSAYSVRLRATDLGGLSTEYAVTISVQNVNETPTDIAISSATIAENNAASATVGNFTTTDVDTLDSFIYTLVAGAGSTDNASFNISANALRLNAATNYEAKSTYNIRIRSTDAGGLWVEVPFVVSITDANDAPHDITLTPATIAENEPVNSVAGALAAIDQDSTHTHSFSLVSGTGSTDNASFEVDGANLKIKVSANFEVKSTYAIRIRATDDGSPAAFYEEAMTVSINNVNETPTISDIANRSINEDTSTGLVAFTIGDVDAGTNFQVTAVSSNTTLVPNDNIAFSGIGTARYVLVSPAADLFGSTDITITVSDGTLSASDTFTLTVNSSNDAPFFTLNDTELTQIGATPTGGTGYSVGTNGYGQLAAGSAIIQTNTVVSMLNVTDFTQVQAGDYGGIGLRANGTVWVWGRNEYGQLANGVTTDSNPSYVPIQVAGLTDVVEVDAGYGWFAVRKSDGTVWAWGRNDFGCLGQGTTSGNSTNPVQVIGLTNVTDIMIGGWGAMALTSEGTVYTWGRNDNGQLGRGSAGVSSGTATAIASLTGNVAKLFDSTGYTFFVEKTDGTMWAWGKGDLGNFGDGRSGGGMLTVITPFQINNLGISQVRQLCAGYSFTLAAMMDGTVKVWGDNADGRLGLGYDTGGIHATPVTMPGLANITQVWAVLGSGYALRSDGRVWEWGHQNGFSPDSYNTPKLATGLTNIRQISAGQSFLLAVGNPPAPVIGLTLDEDSAPGNIPLLVDSFSPGPVDEAGQAVDFLVTNSNNALFSTPPAISTNGTLTYTLATNANGSATVSVRAHDNGGTANSGIDTSEVQTFTVVVNPVNDTPTVLAISASSVLENSAVNTTVGTLSSTDVDAGETFTYTFVNGVGSDDNASFNLNGSSLRTSEIFDFEAKSSYAIRVRTTDGGGLYYENTFVVTVTNVNEMPVFTLGANQRLPYSTGIAQSVSDFATGIDDGDSTVAQTLTFNITGNSNPGIFTVAPTISSSGTLSYTPNAVPGTSTITVTLTDDNSINGNAALTTSIQSFTITVDPAPDYLITTTASTITVTDVNGISDTVTLSNGGTAAVVSAAGRTFSLNGGLLESGSFSLPYANYPIVAQITINAEGGTDTINIGDFSALTGFPSLTVNGGAGDDTVNLNGDINFAMGAHLDLDMLNDHATPGTDNVILATSANLITSGSGTITVKASRNLSLPSGSSLETGSGALTIAMNQQTTATTGDFNGVELLGGGRLRSSSGLIEIHSRGGSTSGHGFTAQSNGRIENVSGNISITATSGSGTGSASRYGVNCYDSTIRTTGGGHIHITGTSFSAGTDAQGLRVGGSSGVFTSGTTAGNIVLTGTGSAAASASINNRGVNIALGASVTSTNGAITIYGTGGAGDSAGLGLQSGTGFLGGVGMTGSIAVYADKMLLRTGLTSLQIRSTGALTLSPLTPGTSIGLGGASGTLNLEDNELSALVDGFSAITIGDVTSGTISIDTASFTDPVLLAGGSIVDVGDVASDLVVTGLAGTFDGNVRPGGVSTSGIMSVTGNAALTPDSTFSVEIGGLTPGTQHDQLNATGSVDIGTSTTLAYSKIGAYNPEIGQVLTIISRTGGTGSFAGAPEGTLLTLDFLGSGLPAMISYVGGDGDDVVIRVANPNIQIEQPTDTVLVNATSTVDFGTRNIAATSAQTFTVRNTGTSDLSLSSLNITGIHAADFAVTTAPDSLVIAPDATTTFVVTFTPSNNLTRTALLSVASNDPDEAVFTIQLQGFGNFVPTDITLTADSVPEHNAAGATVGLLTAVDADLGQTHSFSLVSGAGSADNAVFQIVGDALKILLTTDFESKSAYAIRVRTEDGIGGSYEEAMIITVIDLNDAPEITINNGAATGSYAVSEGHDFVTSVTAYDSDVPFQHLRYSTSGVDAAKFQIEAQSGSLSFIDLPDYENPSDANADNIYLVNVIVTDDGSPNLSASQALSVYVQDLNDAPVIVSNGGLESVGVSIPENTTAVTTVIAEDEDRPLQSLTYNIASGADASRFSIDSSTGVLSFLDAPDADEPLDQLGDNTYYVQVCVTDTAFDPLTDKQEIIVTVTDINEAPTDITLSATSFEERNAVNAVIGNFSAVDQDHGQTHGFSLVSGDGSTDNSAFTVTGSTLSINVSATYATKSSYSLRVRATDSHGAPLSYEKAFTLTVIPAGTAPLAVTNAATLIRVTTATLNAKVTPNEIASTAWFVYGTDPTLTTGTTTTTAQAIGAGTTAATVTAAITGLLPETVYYFRVSAENLKGGTSGSILSFQTSYPLASNEIIPGAPSGDITLLRPLPGPINQAGQISFNATAKTGVNGITTAKDSILISDVSGSLRVIGQEGTAVPGGGTLVGAYTHQILTEGGQTVTLDRLLNSVTAKDYAYFVSPDGLGLELLSREGDVVADGGTFSLHTAKSAADDSERLYFQGTLTGVLTTKNTGVWFDEAGDLLNLAKEGDDFSAITGDPAWLGNFQAMISAGGDGASFIAALQNNPDNTIQKTVTTTNLGIFSGASGSLTMVARKGQLIPSVGKLGTFSGVSRSNLGDHAFISLLSVSTVAPVVSTANDQVLMAEIDGSLQVVARENTTPIVSTLKATRFGNFYMTSEGEVIFMAWLTGTGVTTANDGVLCRWTAEGGIQLLAREGSLAPSTGLNYGIFQVLSVSPGGAIALQSTLSTGITLMRALPSGSLDKVVKNAENMILNGTPRNILTLSIHQTGAGTGGGGGGMGSAINDEGEVFTILTLSGGFYIGRVYP